MDTKFKHLYAPGKIGKLQLKNRLYMPAMDTSLFDADGRMTRRQIEYYAARAAGGIGLIISEATQVERTIETPGAFQLVDSNGYLVAMSDMADAVHDAGGKMFIQLTAGTGRQTGALDPSNPPCAPSAVPAFFAPVLTCREMTVAEIRKLVADFGAAAGRVKAAGFDGIEIHGHTGYLIDQFLSPIWNHRTDEYGGDVHGRTRLAIELIQAVRQATGPDYPLIFRISMEHGFPGGRTLDESLEMARILEAAGVDALNVDGGAYDAMDAVFPPTYLGDAPFRHIAAAVKKVVSIPVMFTGNLTPENAEQALADGIADFVGSGRGVIADPDWPNKVRKGQREDVRPCIRCNEGCVGRLLSSKALSCSVNPLVGLEAFTTIPKAEAPKRVVVIGGGPAGLEAARVAAERGHHVTVIDKAPALGGMLTAAATASFKRPLHDLVVYWETQLNKLGVKVVLNATVTETSLAKLEADAVVVATGATPLLPRIKGIDGKNVIEVVDWHLGRKQITGQNVVMAGGGLSACDAAIEMAEQGKQVTIVEMLPEVAMGLNLPSRMGLLKMLAAHKIKVLTGHKIVAFVPEGVLAQTQDGQEHLIKGDTSVVAFGMKANNSLVEAVQAKWDDVFIVGDCVSPAKVGEAVRAGWNAGRMV